MNTNACIEATWNNFAIALVPVQNLHGCGCPKETGNTKITAHQIIIQDIKTTTVHSVSGSTSFSKGTGGKPTFRPKVFGKAGVGIKIFEIK